LLDNWRLVYTDLKDALAAYKANPKQFDVMGEETGNLIQIFLYNVT